MIRIILPILLGYSSCIKSFVFARCQHHFSRVLRCLIASSLVLISDGSMEDLDGKWILAKDTACPEKDASPATLGLPNMAGPHLYRYFLVLRLDEIFSSAKK